jgi:hypothetical protein
VRFASSRLLKEGVFFIFLPYEKEMDYWNFDLRNRLRISVLREKDQRCHAAPPRP